jgi:hypothetical protein
MEEKLLEMQVKLMKLNCSHTLYLGLCNLALL